ncbi:hypothetical protein [Alicyclobacillus tolerans]|nr:MULTISPECIES: hypothetical protein [Alicyclobacillus]
MKKHFTPVFEKILSDETRNFRGGKSHMYLLQPSPASVFWGLGTPTLCFEVKKPSQKSTRSIHREVILLALLMASLEGIAKVKTHMLINAIAIYASALAVNQMEQHQKTA